MTTGKQPNPAGPAFDQHGQTVYGGQTNINIEGGYHNYPYPPPVSLLPFQYPRRIPHFVGREAELAKLLADLQPGRIVTLCGPSGIGKTALAAEAVWTLAPDNKLPAHFPDGIVYYDFYNNPAISDAFEHIIKSYRETAEPISNLKQAALRELGRRQALVILDSAHYVDNLEALLDIRGRCCVLVISVKHEADAQVISVLPLHDSIRMFQLWAGKRAHSENVVKSICQIFGGFAFAIYIASRYLCASELDAITLLKRLEAAPLDVFESVPELLKRSIDQVSDLAQQSLGVIGLLAPTPFALITIADALTLPSLAALEFTLGELVEFGLLNRPENNYIVSHQLVHTYARERIDASTETLSWLILHFKNLFAQYNRNVNLSATTLAEFDFARPHAVSILKICADRKAWGDLLRLAVAIDDYLDVRGHWTERRIIADLALEAARESHDRANEGKWLGIQGNIAFTQGNYSMALSHHEEALKLSRELDNRLWQGADLAHLGHTYYALGQYQEAITCQAQAREIAQEFNQSSAEAAALNSIGLAYVALNDMAQALAAYERSLAIFTTINNAPGRCAVLANSGVAHATLGDTKTAIRRHEQALTLARELGYRHHEGIILANLGFAYATQKDQQAANAYFQQALEIFTELDSPYKKTLPSR